jgi:hypothetical protein
VDVPIVVALPVPQPGEPFLELNDLIQGLENGLDLNQALEDDLGDIKDLIQAADNLEAEPNHGAPPEEVIDAGIFAEEVPEHNNLFQVQDNNVEVFIPNIQVMLEEIQEDELMDQQPDEEDEQMAEAPVPEYHLQLGFIELIEPSHDPVFSCAQIPKFNAEAIRLWAHFLALGSSPATASIPNIWTDFFTAMLVNPSSFACAKQLLSSSAWNFISQDGKDSVQFALPAQGPKSSFTCLKDMPSLDSLISMEESDNPATPDSKGKGIANSEVPSPATPLEQFQQKISPSTLRPGWAGKVGRGSGRYY